MEQREQITSKTEELLDKVGLPAAEYANRMPSELSGGEQQRIGIMSYHWETKDSIDGRAFSALDAISQKAVAGSYKRFTKRIRHDDHLRNP